GTVVPTSQSFGSFGALTGSVVCGVVPSAASSKKHFPRKMSSCRSPSQSPSKHITVVDVYDLAASIGKDFERIIDQFGNDAVRQLMPKIEVIKVQLIKIEMIKVQLIKIRVISALETLESLANHNERENEEIVSLRKTVERLENEKQAKRQDKVKFEMVIFC
ncbi:unnamed protein product, partial [Anisakis simplex]|uniref:RILP-like protein 1 (inferred by orthology to a human protein) n=1 Tax=Anisakis simplex TaxID=6269 RepID=A0A0M3KFR1_ANISI